MGHPTATPDEQKPSEHSARVRPQTVLPWALWQSQNDHSLNVKSGVAFVAEVGKLGQEDEANDTSIRRDAAYIVHACNAYPRLVEALRDIGWDTTSVKALGIQALLRELGEL